MSVICPIKALECRMLALVDKKKDILRMLPDALIQAHERGQILAASQSQGQHLSPWEETVKFLATRPEEEEFPHRWSWSGPMRVFVSICRGLRSFPPLSLLWLPFMPCPPGSPLTTRQKNHETA